MKTLTALLLVTLSLSSSACFVVGGGPSRRSNGVARSDSRSCHPSQHLENGRCVHNGKGHGARKHDER